MIKPTGLYNGVIPSPTLKKGSKNQSVKLLQQFLNWYCKSKLVIDGIFGKKTLKQLKAFQKTEKVKVDGIYGRVSCSKAMSYKRVNTITQKPYSGAFPDLVVHGGQKIAYAALALAYPLGTSKSKYTYGKGKATVAFQKALNAVFPNRNSWGAKPRAGASCDVASGTVIRYCGVDPKIPRGLEEQIPHLQKSKIFKEVNINKAIDMKAGDVGVYINKGKGAHIWLSVGNKTHAEGSFTNGYFLHLSKRKYTNTNKKVWGIYRVNVPFAIKKGDKGTEVAILQYFLNWYGGYGLKVDGDCGDKTAVAIKDFQEKNGLDADGAFGPTSLAKAKTIKR